MSLEYITSSLSCYLPTRENCLFQAGLAVPRLLMLSPSPPRSALPVWLAEDVPEAALQTSTLCLIAKVWDWKAELQTERFWLKLMYKCWEKLLSASCVWMQ